MQEINIRVAYHQYTITTSDGRRAVSSTLDGALSKLFGHRDYLTIGQALKSVKERDEHGNVMEGQAGA